MVLKGVIYIFVHPNTNSVLAFSLKSQQVFEPMDIHHYPSALNVIEMKEIVSFYARFYIMVGFVTRDKCFDYLLVCREHVRESHFESLY